jgi:cell division protein FtsB
MAGGGGHGEERTDEDSGRPWWRRRRGIVALAGLVLAGWLVITFAGALTEADESSRLAAQLEAENAELRRRVEIGRTEIDLIQTDLFLRLQARAFGMGEEGERPFSLAEGAPPPSPLPLLGADATRRPAATPLDAWLELLFGA